MKNKILAICGSLRTQSSNLSLLKAAEALAPEEYEFHFYNGLDQLPYFNPDNDVEDINYAVARFRSALAEADGVVICTPEYVHGLPGSLKNALDWTVSSGEWMEKPVLILNASPMSHFANDSLAEILTTLMAKVLPHRIGLPGNKMDAAAIAENPEIAAKLRVALDDLNSQS